MRVTLCVDAIEPNLSGIGRYTLELARRLPEQPEIEQLYFFTRRRLVDDPEALYRGDAIYPGRALKRFYRRAVARRALGSTLVHGPNFFLPPAADTGVITVHDLSVLRFPETHPKERVLDFERRLANSVSRASHVITDTETVRQEVIAEFVLPADKVSAVPLGISPSFRPQSDAELRAKLVPFGLAPRGYGLCVATLEPRKRIGELVAAWGDLPSALRLRYPLVIAGGKGWENSGLLDRIATAEREGWLRHLGFVDESQLPALYAGSALFVYPSSYEGFGLPPLEAMASAVPVLVAGRSCLPEICGDAARYVDPDDHDGFRDAIAAALGDENWRSSAALQGQAQAKAFTWDRCVDGTLAVYRQAWCAR